MKLDFNTRFPHPVLSSETGDYLFGEFSIDVEIEETPSSSHVEINYKLTLTETTLCEAISTDYAGVGLFVTCLDSYFNRLVPIGLADSKISFDPGQLIGKVTLRPMIWARKDITNLSLANCHPEFHGQQLDLASGSVLALGDEITISVGREKLAQMETIFSLIEDPGLEDGRLSVQLESERIQILIAKNIYQHLNMLRGLSIGKAILLNSVYLPAVMEVLSNLRDSENEYEGRRWYRIFSAKCLHLGIKTNEADLWHAAQRLLDMPFTEISKVSNSLEG